MSLTAKCPECGHEFRLPEKFAGRRGMCPQCEHVFRAPKVEEEIADWGEVAEEVGGTAPMVAEVVPTIEPSSIQTTKGAGKPRIPLPKRLSEVTPPPAPGADEELPDLASLSVPGGPPPTGPPVAMLADSEGDLPDLSSISEAVAPTAKRAGSVAKPAQPIIQPAVAAPDPPGLPSDSSPVPDLSSLSVDAGGPGGPIAGTGPKRKRRSSDVFDANELAAQLGQTDAALPQSLQDQGTPQVGPPSEGPPRPKSSSPIPKPKSPAPIPKPKAPAKPKSAAPKAQPKPTSPAPQPKTPSPAKKPAPKPSAGPAAKSPKLVTAKPLATPMAESSTKVPAKPKPAVAAEAKDEKAGFPDLNLQPKITGKPTSQTPVPAAKPIKAKAAASSGAAKSAAAPIAVTTEGADRGTRPATGAGRTPPRKKPWMLIAVGGALAGLLLCIVAVWAINSALNSGDDDELAQIEDGAGQPSESAARDEEGGTTDRDSEGSIAVPEVTLAEISALKWDEARDAVVLIEVITEERKELGAGFLIEPRGWVATAYSLIHHGRYASIVTADGRKLAVEGTVAKDPELDLAILKVEDPGDHVSLITLPLDNQLERLDKKAGYIFGDRFRSQKGTSQCTALQSISIGELRASLRPFITEAARENGLLNWIELDGHVSGTAHGGPVIDADGKVIGVAEYLGEIGSRGYAIHVKHLRDLKKKAAQVEPLVPDPLARSDRPDRPGSVAELSEDDRRLLSPPAEDSADADNSDSVVQSDPTRADPGDSSSFPGSDSTAEIEPPPGDAPFSEPKDITAAKLEETLAACDELRFVPSEEDYVTFQNLAFLLTEVQRIADNEDTPANQREKQKEIAEKVVNRLSRERWVDVENINKLAVDALANPHRGMFFYASVIGAQENFQPLEGRTGVFLRVIDTDKYVLFPTKLGADEFPRGSRWLILGIHNPRPRAIRVEINGEPHVPEHLDTMFIVGEPESK